MGACRAGVRALNEGIYIFYDPSPQFIGQVSICMHANITNAGLIRHGVHARAKLSTLLFEPKARKVAKSESETAMGRTHTLRNADIPVQ